MAAFQALASGAIDIIAATAYPSSYIDVNVQNIGPNNTWVEVGGVATVLGSSRVAPGENMGFRRAPGQRVSIIASTADQVAGADTRVQVA